MRHPRDKGALAQLAEQRIRPRLSAAAQSFCSGRRSRTLAQTSVTYEPEMIESALGESGATTPTVSGAGQEEVAAFWFPGNRSPCAGNHVRDWGRQQVGPYCVWGQYRVKGKITRNS